VNFEKPAGDKQIGKQAASIALGACGLLFMTIQFLMAPTHTIGGVNYSNVWHATLTVIGLALVGSGMAAALYTRSAKGRGASLPVTVE
jgi:hypothetical protein